MPSQDPGGIPVVQMGIHGVRGDIPVEQVGTPVAQTGSPETREGTLEGLPVEVRRVLVEEDILVAGVHRTGMVHQTAAAEVEVEVERTAAGVVQTAAVEEGVVEVQTAVAVAQTVAVEEGVVQIVVGEAVQTVAAAGVAAGEHRIVAAVEMAPLASLGLELHREMEWLAAACGMNH